MFYVLFRDCWRLGVGNSDFEAKNFCLFSWWFLYGFYRGKSPFFTTNWIIFIFVTTLSKSKKNIAEAVVVWRTCSLSIFVHGTFIGRYLCNLGWRMILEFLFPKCLGNMISNLTFDMFFIFQTGWTNKTNSTCRTNNVALVGTLACHQPSRESKRPTPNATVPEK